MDYHVIILGVYTTYNYVIYNSTLSKQKLEQIMQNKWLRFVVYQTLLNNDSINQCLYKWFYLSLSVYNLTTNLLYD